MFLELNALIYDEVELRNADLETSYAIKEAELSDSKIPGYDYQRADNLAKILPVMIHISDLWNLKCIASSYPVIKRKKDDTKEVISLCQLTCRHSHANGFDLIQYENIVGTAPEITKQINEFLNVNSPVAVTLPLVSPNIS